MAKLTLAGKIYNILQKYEDKQERVEKIEALFNEYRDKKYYKEWQRTYMIETLAELSVPKRMRQFVVKVQPSGYCTPASTLSVNLSEFQKESEFIILMKRVYERLQGDMRDFDIYQSTGIHDLYPTAVKHLDERWDPLSKYTKLNRSDMALKGEAHYGVKLVVDNTCWKEGPAFNYDDSWKPHTCSWLRYLVVM